MTSDEGLSNGGFESEWKGSHRCYVLDDNVGYHYADIGNFYCPDGWTGWFSHGNIYKQPEAHSVHYSNPDRYFSGLFGFQIFTFGRCHDAGLFQQVNVTPESRIEFSAYAHAWSNHNDDSMPDVFPHGDDPKWSEGAGFRQIGWRTDTLETTGEPQDDAKLNFAFSVGIDPFGGVNPLAKSVVWSADWSIYNGFVHELSVEAVAVSSTVTVFLRSNTLYPFKHNDAYWDDASLVKSPPEGQCRGQPREQYARTYYTFPHLARWEDYAATVRDLFLRRRTMGFSWDDAGIGDLDSRTATMVDTPDKDVAVGWFDEHYPEVDVQFIQVKEDPPPTKAPPTTGWIGIHQLQNQPNGMVEWQGMGPIVCKAVDRIDQIIAMYRATPEHLRPWLRMFFRKYHPDEGSFRYDAEMAAFWIPYVTSDLAIELNDAGVPTNQVWVLGLNEVWEHNFENNAHTIRFDMRALSELHKFNMREGTFFKYCGSSAAVGNWQRPDEPGGEMQWNAVLPLARAFHEFDYNDAKGECCFNWHAYGICSRVHPEWLIEYGPWLQHRWMYGYDWLKAKGVPVPFFHGEGGHVVGNVVDSNSASALAFTAQHFNRDKYAVNIPEKGVAILFEKRKLPVVRRADVVETQGMWLNPGRGWVGEIDPARAIRELVDEFDEPIRLKNAENDYKASYGNTTFQWGNRSDWDKFNYEQLADGLRVAMVNKYNALEAALG